MRPWLRNSAWAICLPVSLVILTLVAWEAFVQLKDVSPLVLPSPLAIAKNIGENVGAYLADAFVTLRESLLGFALALAIVFPLAIAMLWSRKVELAVSPHLAAMRSVPIVAFAPALVLLFGFDDRPKILIAAFVCFPAIFVNTLSGLRAVNPEMLEVLRCLRASRWEEIVKVRMPTAVPYLMSGMRVAIALAIVGAVVGEWAGSASGLGYRIVRAQHDLETVTVWGATVVLGLMGVVVSAILLLLELPLRRRLGISNHKGDVL